MKMKSVDQGIPVEGPEGVIRKTLAYDDEAMLCHFTLKAGARIPLHSHRAVQVGYVISGKMLFKGESPDDEFQVKKGDSYIFSADKTHGAEVVEDAEFVEVFTPAREEYKDF